MTKAEKISVLLAAVLLIICAVTAFKPKPGGITAEKTAPPSELLNGGGEEGKELLPGDKVNINTASSDELCMLPDVGETIAQRIIDWRDKNGDFKSVDELVDEIDGIGENNIEDMREYIVLEDDVS